LFELAGGAVTDFKDTCFPQIQREASFTVVALHQWKLDEYDPNCVLTAEEVCSFLLILLALLIWFKDFVY